MRKCSVIRSIFGDTKFETGILPYTYLLPFLSLSFYHDQDYYDDKKIIKYFKSLSRINTSFTQKKKKKKKKKKKF